MNTNNFALAEAYNETYKQIEKEALHMLFDDSVGTPILFVVDNEIINRYRDCSDVSFYRVPSCCKDVDQLEDMYCEGLLEPEELEKMY